MSSASIKALAIDDVTDYYDKPYPFDFYPQSFRDEMTSNMRKAIETGCVIEQEIAALDKKGNEIWFHSTINPIKNNKNKIDYLMIVSIDTSLQHIAAQKLQQLNDDFEAEINKRTLELQTLNQQLLVEAETDFLTKLYNRFAFKKRLAENIATAKRSKQFLTLLMIDVDHFKNYNDKYGHYTGDIILQKIADTIDNSLPRKTDFCARFGGEEFVVLLPDTEVIAGHIIAERIRTNVEHLKVHLKDKQNVHNATVSIGIAAIKGDELNADVLFKRADKALFKAKNSGRNNCKIVDIES
jgi:diguanylate cyclase (GGDEF)-like protein